MALGSVVIDLLLKTGAFISDSKVAEKRLQEMKKTAVDVGKVIGTAIATGATVATAAIVSWTREITALSEQTRILAELSGTTNTLFQEWAAGARSVGIEQDKLADIFKDMQDRVGDFMQTGGGPMADFFENIAPKVGVTADQFARLSGPESLQLFVDSLQRAGVSANDMVFYMEAIASDSTKLIPLLADGGQKMREWGEAAHEAGAIMSDEMIVAMQASQAEIQRLSLAYQGVKIEVAQGVTPAISEFTELLNDPDTRDGMVSLAQGLVLVATKALEAASAFGRLIQDYKNWLQQRGLVPDSDELDALEARRQKLMATQNKAIPGLIFGSQLQEELDLVEKRINEIRSKSIVWIDPSVPNSLRGADFQNVNSSAISGGSPTRPVGGNPAPATAAVIRHQEEVEKALTLDEEWALLVSEVYTPAMIASHNERALAWANEAEVVQEATNEMTVFAEQAGRNMQDAFADFLFDPFEEGLGGMVQSFAKTLQRMAAEMAASEAMKMLAGYGSDNSGTWWGAALSSMFGGQRATGGPVSGSKLYEVGEGGNPELFTSGGRTFLIPGNNGTVIPASSGSAAMAGGVNIEIINNTGQEVRTERTQTPDGQALERIIIGTVNKGFGQGAFDGAMGMFGNQRRGMSNG